jgi:hypothetical protein
MGENFLLVVFEFQTPHSDLHLQSPKSLLFLTMHVRSLLLWVGLGLDSQVLRMREKNVELHLKKTMICSLVQVLFDDSNLWQVWLLRKGIRFENSVSGEVSLIL